MVRLRSGASPVKSSTLSRWSCSPTLAALNIKVIRNRMTLNAPPRSARIFRTGPCVGYGLPPLITGVPWDLLLIRLVQNLFPEPAPLRPLGRLHGRMPIVAGRAERDKVPRVIAPSHGAWDDMMHLQTLPPMTAPSSAESWVEDLSPPLAKNHAALLTTIAVPSQHRALHAAPYQAAHRVGRMVRIWQLPRTFHEITLTLRPDLAHHLKHFLGRRPGLAQLPRSGIATVPPSAVLTSDHHRPRGLFPGAPWAHRGHGLSAPQRALASIRAEHEERKASQQQPSPSCASRNRQGSTSSPGVICPSASGGTPEGISVYVGRWPISIRGKQNERSPHIGVTRKAFRLSLRGIGPDPLPPIEDR